MFAFLLFLSCSDNFLDVNIPSNSKKSKTLTLNELLSPTIYHTVNAHYWAERTLGNYTQYFTGQTGSASGVKSLSATWNEIYYKNLVNAFAIQQKAKENNSPKFTAIANILVAMNIGLATDCWGNIPYTEAAKDLKIPKPKFDSQEFIYSEIDNLLQKAITNLENTSEKGEDVNPINDLVYKGDMSKWLKLAYTLRARYKMHLSKVLGSKVAMEVLDYLKKGMNSNADDFQLSYTSKNINPWHSREVLAKNTGNDHDKIGNQLVNYMNGKDYVFTNITIDPRLPVYASINNDSSDWKGYVSGGEGKTYDGSKANTDFKDSGFYTSRTSPIVLLSYSEALFLKAEAEFLKNNGTITSVGSTTNAYNAYINAIKANMSKLGVSYTKYINEPSIAVGESNLKLEHIMKEKYIANFLNPETFVDFRRYNFSQNVYKNLTLPADNSKGEFPNKWLVRANYPSLEEQGNSGNVSLNKKSPITPVWWDK